VLDQFEQWLHARRAEAGAELAQALRQCDGERLQCVVLVRDDFWLAVSRFLGALDIELLQGHNSALVDLFDLRHARKVLAAFGQAFGAIADAPSAEEEAFLDRAVQHLTAAAPLAAQAIHAGGRGAAGETLFPAPRVPFPDDLWSDQIGKAGDRPARGPSAGRFAPGYGVRNELERNKYFGNVLVVFRGGSRSAV
jgi:hypothetical protein